MHDIFVIKFDFNAADFVAMIFFPNLSCRRKDTRERTFSIIFMCLLNASLQTLVFVVFFFFCIKAINRSLHCWSRRYYHFAVSCIAGFPKNF